LNHSPPDPCLLSSWDYSSNRHLEKDKGWGHG
jgi:hypothetical protein